MSKIIKRVKTYCTNLITTSKCKELPYHNIDHTQDVVDAVIEISKAAGISNNELKNCIIAAWFHDTGFSLSYKNHEYFSKKIAENFLEQELFKRDQIKVVLSCIEGTKLGEKPISNLEKIICDADLYHLTECNYIYRNTLLRKEWEIELGKIYSDKEWYELNYKFLKDHFFYNNKNELNLNQKLNINIKKVENLFSICS